MKKIFFTPGPSQNYTTIEKHIKRALADNILAISHRSKLFQEIYADTVKNLRELLKIPDNYSVFFLSSATEAMERVIENCVESKSFHFVNGSFSERFFLTAGETSRHPEKFETKWGEGFNFKKNRPS